MTDQAEERRVERRRARLLAYKQLNPEKGIRYSRQYIGRLEKAGRFPRRVHLGPNSVGWLEDELDGWLGARIAERDGDR